MNTAVRLSAAVASLTLFAGCQTYYSSSDAALAPEPQAVPVFANTTQPVRDWDRSVAYIANGDTVAGSPGLRYRTRDDLPIYAYSVAEPGVFLANLVTLPYTRYVERGPHLSTGAQYAPTHTAMPMLPPSPQVEPQPGLTEPLPEPTPIADPTVTPGSIADVAGQTPAPSFVLAPSTQPNARQTFTISGQVVRAGSFDLTPASAKLSQVIVAAEPATQDPTKVRVSITREGEEPASTTLAELLSGDAIDIEVMAGDVIVVELVP